MRKMISAVLLGVVLAVAAASPAFVPAASAQAGYASLSGEWRGVYVQGRGSPTEFTASLRERNGQFTGTTIEPNRFAAQTTAAFLLADLSGEVRGDVVRFVKTYDGTGGQSHSVSYEGRLVSDRHIVGTWSLTGDSGSFEMVR